MGLVQRIENYLIRRARRRARPIVVKVFDHIKRRFPDPRIRWDDYRFRVAPPNGKIALEIFNHMFERNFSEKYGVGLRLDQNDHIWIF